MKRTVLILAGLVLALSAGMTVFMSLSARDSAIHPGLLLPVALLPTFMLGIITWQQRHNANLGVCLVFSLLLLRIGFDIYFEGIFVRHTTLHAGLFPDAAIKQFACVGGLLLCIWRCLLLRGLNRLLNWVGSSELIPVEPSQKAIADLPRQNR